MSRMSIGDAGGSGTTGESVRLDIQSGFTLFFPATCTGVKRKGEEFDLLVHDPGIYHQVKGLVDEDRYQWLMVEGRGEVREAEEKVPTLVCPPACCQCLTFNGGVGLFGLRAEPATEVDCLPSCLAATGD